MIILFLTNYSSYLQTVQAFCLYQLCCSVLKAPIAMGNLVRWQTNAETKTKIQSDFKCPQAWAQLKSVPNYVCRFKLRFGT